MSTGTDRSATSFSDDGIPFSKGPPGLGEDEAGVEATEDGVSDPPLLVVAGAGTASPPFLAAFFLVGFMVEWKY